MLQAASMVHIGQDVIKIYTKITGKLSSHKAMLERAQKL